MARINYDFYQGNDKYSDGDIENFFLDSLKLGLTEQEILNKNENDWPTHYHFSRDRWNLLRWLDLKGKSVLEIGGGCGALTGFFLENAKEVSVIELSKRRAEIILERFKHFNDLEIFVGAAQDVGIEKKFDVVTSIGVMEYAAFIFPEEDKPQARFLRYLKDRMNDGGQLVLAIENALGIKYFAGAAEDHTGKLFDGITDYQNSLIKTFGRHELRELLKEAGFNDICFYYPYPDYKFCDQVFSDDYPPQTDNLTFSHVPNFDQDRFCLFDERLLSNKLIRNNIILDFMNSFLVIAR